VGAAITLNDRSYTVTGVMPPWFRFPVVTTGSAAEQHDVWIWLDPAGKGHNRAEGWYFCYARMKPGVTFAQAEADVKRVAAGIAKRDPAGHYLYTARLHSLRGLLIKEIRPTLLLLFAAAGLLLLITCANVAGLLLSRSVARARETAIRVALGAAQRQLAVQYFVEGLFVSVVGAAVGVLLSVALVRIVISLAGDYIPRSDEIAVDWTVLGFAHAAAVVASLLFSLAPLWQAVRTLPVEVLSDGGRTSAGARSRKLSRSLVVAEIALAFALLAAGAVLIQHLDRLNRVWPGFDVNQLLTFELALSDTVAAKGETRVPHQIRLARALEAVPGVSGVGFSNQFPFNCCFGSVVYPEGRPPDATTPDRSTLQPVPPSYFQTMRIPLVSGRLLTYQDAQSKILPVVINQTAARHYWPDQNPVGVYGRMGARDGSRFQVVGVVGDVRNDGLSKPPVSDFYILHTVWHMNPMRFVVRSQRPAQSLLADIRKAIRAIDAAQPIQNVRTMREIARSSLTLERAASFMTSFFALAALLMAMLGVYGVVSYSVRQRTVEIGTRMALGAQKRDLLTLIVGGGLKTALYGVALGSLAVMGAATALVKVFEIRDLGWLPFALSTAVVAGVSMLASFFPAWRATLLSPMVAIRDEPGSVWRTARASVQQAMKRVSEAVSGDRDAPAVSDANLLTEFVEAARRAASYGEALRIVLATLCSRFQAESAILLERTSVQEYRCAGVIPEGKASDCPLPADGFLLKRLRFSTFPLPLTPGDFDTWLRWANEQRPEHAAELIALRNTGARIAVPLRTRSEILGVLLLGPPEGREEYGSAEKRVLRRCGEQLALMLEHARLTDRVVEQEKLRRDLALAAEVQKRLLPEHAPELANAALAAISLPARSVGGDYYDFFDAGNHSIGIALADVAGKGVAAALIMSVVQASLRILSADGNISLPQLAAKLNRFLHRSTGSSSYATFFYAQIDEAARQLRYVNAGHNPPYLLRAVNAEIQELSTGGTVIGLFPQMRYEEAAIDLNPGDLLVAFTDGLPEALNPSDEEFGEERLKDLLRQVAHLPVPEISTRISQELKNWIHDAAQYDDLTFIVMKVN
ncbi:MAG: SpoIIE family protein phosphatase, partial [Bryobacteraceae bacterium]